MKNQNALKKTVITAVFSATALVLFFFEFPLLPSSFLKMDFSDLVAAIGGIVLGPWYAVVVELIKNLLEMLLKGLGSTMGFGNLSNFIVGVAYTVPFSAVFRAFIAKNGFEKTKLIKGALVSSFVGGVAMLAIGYFANLFVTPMYFRFFVGQALTKEYVIGFAATATLFNAIKIVIMSVALCLILPISVERLKKTVD